MSFYNDDDDGRADYEAYHAEEMAGELEEMLELDEMDEDDVDWERFAVCLSGIQGFPYRDLIERATRVYNSHQQAHREMADLDRSERFMRMPMNEPESMGD